MAQFVLLFVSLALCLGFASATISIDGNGDVTVYMFEHSDIGTALVDFHATDSNGGSITWSLDDIRFSINSLGVVEVASTAIDREALPSPHVIEVTVTATSGSDSASVLLLVVVLDINDNHPVFENTNTNSDSFSLEEDVPVFSIVYTMIASDPDYGAGGNHHFVNVNPDGFFSVGYFTGDIELVQSLDHETNTLHTITVNIQDEGVPQLTTVVTITVTILDTEEIGPIAAQQFYHASIFEGTFSSSLITTVFGTPGASDGIIEYTIIDSDQDWIDQFSVGATSGVVTVSGILDRELKSRYVVGIEMTELLSDGVTEAQAPTASTTVVLILNDINDNAPQFFTGTYTGFVDENEEQGHIVLPSIVAFDADIGTNSEFTYRISARQPDYEFQMNPVTGVINVTGSLDYEAGPIMYIFTILAAETETAVPLTGTAVVTIYVLDVNDHGPLLSGNKFEYTIEENSLKAFTPTIMASDSDASTIFNTLTFEINGIGTESPYDHFMITEMPTNTIQLSNKVTLDKESIDFYHIIVTVRDNGPEPFSSTADIYVEVTDVNDFPPKFDQATYSADIDEETVYTTCVQVSAKDTGDADSINTGITYTLSVTSSSINTSLADLQNKFSIDGTTGVVTCGKINHEFGYRTIILTVTATDSGINPGPLTDTATITISINNLNEHPPIFDQGSYAATIPESHGLGQPIGVTVVATQGGSDNSEGHVITYSIVEGNTNGAITIDEDSGVMTLASQLGIDYEQLNPNPIIVRVEAVDTVDSEGTVYSATVTVTITVTDVNEFAPLISTPLGNPVYIVSEGESSLPKTITTMQATDSDGTLNTITYSITPPTYGTFEIGSSTGIVTMTVTPDREAIIAADDRFTIMLTATDQGIPPMSSMTTITIEITDINDHDPVFDLDMFTISPIPENTMGAVSLLTIHAEDNFDIGVNAEISYKIASINPIKPGVKFQLGGTTGVLQTGSAGFDHEDSSDRMYTIVMVAEDGGIPVRTDTATATIEITDVNDNPPILCVHKLEFTMDEFSGSTLSASDVVILTDLNCITDADSISTSFQYRLVDASKTNGWFDVDSSNGNIYIPIGTNIDREHADTIVDSFGRAIFTFEVEVTDTSFSNGDYFSDEAEITVYINDINDNSPVFTETSIVRSLPEGVPIGTVVDIVSATDNDFITNAIITYSETSGDPDDLFSVSSDGEINTAKVIDKEMILSAITFIITATDNGGLTDTITVTVTITDTNDNNPVFDPTFYQTSIQENVGTGTPVVVVDATDGDTGVNGEVSYEITGGNVNGAFEILVPTKGDIQVAGPIDRETLSFYRLIIVAKDGATGTFQRTAVAEVAITITDVNDNTPIFLHQVHNVSIAEDIANNTFVPVSPSIYATDADIGANAVIMYDIEAGFPFSINKATGFVYTSYSSILDREMIDSYSIIVYARDTGGLEASGTLLVTITDINDNSPIIDQSSADLDITISEYFPANGLIGVVTATDQDIGVNRLLRYSLTGGEGYFQVDPNSGTVTLSQTIQNIERRDPFSVTITVTDGGIPALQDEVSFQVQVTDENDNPPILTHSPLVYVYPEDTDVSSPIQLDIDPTLTAIGVVEDSDEGINQEYMFVLGSSSSAEFDLDSQTGSLFFTSAMDYETQITYSGSIYVVDKGSPALTSSNQISIMLTVTDVNDLPPVLDEDVFSTNVSEYTIADVPLLLVTATDGDTLDDNIVIAFSLTDSSPAHGLDLFKIDINTGLVLTKTFLEDSDKGCYVLNIKAENPGTNLIDTGEAKICITDQNESPDFDQSFYNFSIYENEAANYVLGSITATDPDSDPNHVTLTYTLVTNVEDNGLFAIDKTTGLLTTLVPLDREMNDLHVLTVIAQDDGNDNFQHTNYTTIIVNVLDVNDNNPQLVHSTFNSEYVISENVTRNTTIANITATDVDLATINLFRIVTDEKTLFKIDHQTGHLQTEAGPEDFDREAFLNYTITIEVYNSDDPTKVDQANIIFILTDVNDNAPYFTFIPADFCISENSPNGLDLGTFTAGDLDIDINARVFYQITGGNTAQAFTIEALTGKLKTQNPLDYEEDPLQYTLTIEVQDLGIPPLSASAEITICIEDTNDNSPFFVNPITDPVIIEEHTEKGYVIAKFSTNDIDSPPFDVTQLTLISGNDKGAFVFVQSNNTLYVNDPSILDYEGGILTYTLTIEAVDVDDTTKRVTTSVTILITDINDHPPYFDKTLFNITIFEDETLDTILAQVVASDVDSSVLTYELVLGNDDGKFSLNQTSGILSLVNTLDYEELPNYYMLSVDVTDGDFFDRAIFHIYIENINDVHPVITQPPLSPHIITLPENTPPGFLYTTEAYDVEGGDLTFSFANGELSYSVVTINSTSGIITLSGGLDYETDVFYEFVVVVMDNGIPVSLQDSVHFQIIVTDVNDHFPTFSISSQIKELYENHSIGIGASFLSLTGEDIDVTDTAAGNFYYFVVSESGYLIDNKCVDIFCVDSEMGKVYHNRLLDYESFILHSTTFAISNYKTAVTDITVEDQGLDTITIEIRVLDNNDNAPVFTTFTKLIGVADDTRFQSIIYTCKTSDLDTFFNYDKVWYRFLTYGSPFDLDTESCIIRTVGEFEGRKGELYVLTIEGYDNEGKNPSLSSDETVKVYIYNNEDNSVITTFINQTAEDIDNNAETITEQLSNITGSPIIITDIRYTILTGGQVDTDSVDVIFVVIGDNDQVEKNTDVINNLGMNVTIFIDTVINNTEIITVGSIHIPDPIVVNKSGDIIPIWVIIVIIVILGAIICMLCCCLCAFLIVEKRRKRKVKEDKLYSVSDFSVISSKQYASTQNPLFLAPAFIPPNIDLDLESVSVDESIVRPNPIYEEQEINIDLFDGNAAEDSFSVSSKDALLPPPIDSSSITRVERLPPLPPPKKRVQGPIDVPKPGYEQQEITVDLLEQMNMVADDTFSITSQDAELLLSSTYVATDESLLPKKRVNKPIDKPRAGYEQQEIAIDVFGGNASDDTISITSEGAELLLDPSTDHSQLPMKLKKKPIDRPRPGYEHQEIVFDGNVFDGNVSDNDSITSEDAKLLLSHLSTAAPDEFQPSLESKFDEPVDEARPGYEEQEISIDVFGGNLSEDSLSITSKDAELYLQPLNIDNMTTVESTDQLRKLMKSKKNSATRISKRDDIKKSVAPAVLKSKSSPFSFSSTEEDDDHDEVQKNIMLLPPPKPNKGKAAQVVYDNDEVTVDFMEQFDEDSDDPSSTDLLEKANKHFSATSYQQHDDMIKMKKRKAPKMIHDKDEMMVDFMEEFDDEDPPSSDPSATDLLEKARKHFSATEDDGMDSYHVV